MNNQIRIQSEHRIQQQKFIYYLIALCVTSIGYSVYRTIGVGLNYSQIVLLFSIVSWSISIFYGLKFLKISIEVLYKNNMWYDVRNKRLQELKDATDETIEQVANKLQEHINNRVENNSKHIKYQENLFYVGMVFFIIWHILEMYLKT